MDPQEPAYRTTLGMAQYRVGKYEDAVKTLMRAAELHERNQGSPCPADLAFLAMAQHEMGKQKEAQTALQRLREIVKVPNSARREDARTYLREADARLNGPATDASK
jgi:Flp pilus assembly protein TadD